MLTAPQNIPAKLLPLPIGNSDWAMAHVTDSVNAGGGTVLVGDPRFILMLR